MILKELEYQRFRNLVDARIPCAEDFNFIIGENAAGKTNLLEVIFYAALASSFRTNEEKNLIKFNENFLRVSASSNGKTASIYYDGEKKLTLEGNRKHRLSEFIGWLLVTILSLEDIWLVRGAPVKRRAFLDWLIIKFTPSYLVNLTEYRKILRQRNQALWMVKENGNLGLLDIYDEQLVTYGNEIYKERKKNLPELKESVARFGNEFGLDNLALNYQSTCPDMVFDLGILKSARPKEIKWGETVIGPHRDDLLFMMNGYPLKDYASEGEERAMAIALKLAEAEVLYNKTKNLPILLLDEVAAELDHNKKQILFNILTRWYLKKNGQIFYTSTQMPDFAFANQYKKFIVKRGFIEVS